MPSGVPFFVVPGNTLTAKSIAEVGVRVTGIYLEAVPIGKVLAVVIPFISNTPAFAPDTSLMMYFELDGEPAISVAVVKRRVSVGLMVKFPDPRVNTPLILEL